MVTGTTAASAARSGASIAIRPAPSFSSRPANRASLIAGQFSPAHCLTLFVTG